MTTPNSRPSPLDDACGRVASGSQRPRLGVPASRPRDDAGTPTGATGPALLLTLGCTSVRAMPGRPWKQPPLLADLRLHRALHGALLQWSEATDDLVTVRCTHPESGP